MNRRRGSAIQRAGKPSVTISVQGMGTIRVHGGDEYPHADRDLYEALVPWVEDDLPGFEHGDTIHLELTTGN